MAHRGTAHGTDGGVRDGATPDARPAAPSADPPRPGPVVVGIDGSARAADAVAWAATEARRHGAPLCLVRAHHCPPWARSDLRRAVRQAALDELEQARELAGRVAPDVAVEAVSTAGDPLDVLVQESADARMVVVGVRGTAGFGGLRAGSTATGLPVRARCPVVVVREPTSLQADTAPVVVGVDATPCSGAALAVAFAEADAWDVPLVAVHAWLDDLREPQPTPTAAHRAALARARALLAARLAGCTARYPDVVLRQEVPAGRAAKALVARSLGARMVVVGSHGTGVVARTLLGSTSRPVLQHAHCPVVVVPAG
jgi:nucleotide-binding universal stress UspA family protein